MTPSRHPDPTLAEVEKLTARAAQALGLREGPVHAELRIDATGELTILELAARLIGGLCSRSLRFGAGVSLEEVILRHALGMGVVGLTRETQASGVMMLPIRSAGILDRVSGQDQARAVDGVVGLEISIPLGREVVPSPTATAISVHLRPRRNRRGGRGGLAPGSVASTPSSATIRSADLSHTTNLADVRVLLVSTYELGNQPLGLAKPAAALEASGHQVRCVDVAVDRSRWPSSTGRIEWRSRCRCTPPCDWPSRWPTRSGPGDPSSPCASTASTPR